MDRKDSYTEVFLKAAGVECNEKNLKDYKAVWWQSMRSKESGGLRLTDQGLEFVEKYSTIKTYKIEIPKELSITPQILVWLDQYIDSPFHLTKKHMKVLSERAAFELYLFSGDVKKYGISKTMAKRRSQESTPD
jgi:hypothetical protein